MSESDAADLSTLIEARKEPPAPPKAAQRRLGSRPRSDASMERRRRAFSGVMPPALAGRFTLAEQSVLGAIAAAVVRHGRCTLVIDHTGALAGVSRTTVRNALREAQRHGLVRIG